MRVGLHGFTGDCDLFSDYPIQGIPMLGHSPERPVLGDETFASEVAALWSALPEQVELIGYSMGARLALAMAVSHPERVQRLVLVAGRDGLHASAQREERADLEASWSAKLLDEGIEAFVRFWEELPLWRSQSRCTLERLARQRQTRLSHDPLALAASLQVLGLSKMPALNDKLATLRCPVTFVAGSEDEKFVELAKDLALSTPKSEVHVIPQCGHNPFIECPSALQDLVGSFD